MWKDNEKAPVWEFLGWVVLLSIVCNVINLPLERYSIAFQEEGTLTVGYVIYAITGVFLETPNPLIATYITLKRHKKIDTVKDFCRLIFDTPNIAKTVLITGAFCAAALCMALIYGIPTGAPWYMFIIALPVMVIGGGIEEVGWRGFLQPALEEKFSFPIATILVSIIWYAWHLPIWLQPSSNHYGDSLIGFAIMIFVWSFIGAAIFKATKSVFACVMYHAFINAIGAVFDWNALFDRFPNQGGMYVYFCVALIAAVALTLCSRKDSINETILRK